MKFKKVDDSKFIAVIDSTDLDQNNLSVQLFMCDSEESKILIEDIKYKILQLYNMTFDLVLKNIYYYKGFFLIEFLSINSNVFYFHSIDDFNDFCFAVKCSKFSDFLTIDENTKEISLKNIDNKEIFNLLKEFTY